VGLAALREPAVGFAAKINTPESTPAGDSRKLKVRDALFEHPNSSKNTWLRTPKLSTEELDIVESWKRFVAGEFMVERFLKKGAIFIGSHDPPSVYLVLGLHSSIEEILPPYGAPYYVKAVLLPFRGRIIYDGLLEPYSLFFGSGIRGSLRESYLRAKQRGEIIETLTAPVERNRGAGTDRRGA
jgi:hypothetical protein